MSLIILPKEYSPVHIKKYRDREIELPCAGHVGVGGYFRLECVKDDGRSFWLTDWFHNNVTNVGLDMMATNTGRYGCCQVGSGNSAPANSDTALQTFLAGTSSRSFQGNTYVAGPPAYIQSYIRYDFAINQVIGNISELGVGPSASTGTNLFSRELIRDAAGNPTTVSVPSNSQVRVHYKIRHYPPMVDVPGVLNGTIYGGAATRNFTRRAAMISSINNINYSATWEPFNERQVVAPIFATSSGTYTYITGSDQISTRLASGAIGGITGYPSNTKETNYSYSASSYSSGSFNRNIVITIGHLHVTGDIKSILYSAGSDFRNIWHMSACPFQVEFDTAIAKGANDTFAFTVGVSWGRYP